MPKLSFRPITFIVSAAVAIAISLVLFHKPVVSPAVILSSYDPGAAYKDIEIKYPYDKTIFPQELPAPDFRWEDSVPSSNAWLVNIRFDDDKGDLNFLLDTVEWTPGDNDWKSIKERSIEKDALVTIIGVNRKRPKKILSSSGMSFTASKDKIGASLFYREVNLPFVEAVKDPSNIRWRFGSISSKTQPPVILQDLPVCGNCHSFSSDGTMLGMDIDYANDKGSYIISGVEKDITLSKEKVITWADYKKEDGELTYGLLSQVSPDGKYVVSTVKDRSVFVPKPDIEYSQLFFPVKGILCVYSIEDKTFKALKGADDAEYVQSNASWSPDNKYIIFTKSKAYKLKTKGDQVLLTEEECKEFLKDGKTFLFDIYRVPFNNAEGGEPEPLKGASHNGMSNYFPRYSPDGKWIVFCKAKSFSLLQPDSKLYIMPAEGGNPRLMDCNLRNMNSWHSWSPNSRWLVFSSKANTPYTQLFLTHIDTNGNSSPPVSLAHLTSPDRAANIPEFVNLEPDAIKKMKEDFLDDVSFVRAGDEHMKAGDYRNAALSYKKSLEFNPQNTSSHNNLGVCLMRLSDYQEAVYHFKEVLKAEPKHSEALYNLGYISAKLSKHDEAIAYYKRALESEPADEEILLRLSEISLNKNDLDKALFYCEEILKKNPENPAVLNNAGSILARLNRLDEAILYLEKAVKLNPDIAEFYYNLANAFAIQGRYEEAIAQYTEALILKLDYAEARSNLNMLLRKKRNNE